MDLLEIINFEIECTLLEMKSSFNLQYFKKLQEPQEQKEYADKHLKYLGSGSSREVYLLSNRYVLKLAIGGGGRGVGQNKAEVDVYTDPKTKPIVAKVYDFHPEYMWMISEVARIIKSKDEFIKLANLGDDVSLAWALFDSAAYFPTSYRKNILEDMEKQKEIRDKLENAAQTSEGDPLTKRAVYAIKSIENKIENLQIALESPFLKAVSSLVHDSKVLPGDTVFSDHWGKTADGRLILIDYGFTRDVADLYYS